MQKALNETRTGKIGVFDSGFGGLTVMRGIVRALPEYDYVYFGDNARAPYGTRSQDVVFQFTKEAVEFLFGEGCDLVILACNTASSEALRRIQREVLPAKYPNKRVLGVLIPAAEEAVRQSVSKRVGVIATAGTVASNSFQREISKLDKKVRLSQKACPLLVSIVEEGEDGGEIAKVAIKKYLKYFEGKKIDTLILGCTHYGFLEKEIAKNIGKNVRIVSEGKVVPKRLVNYLKRHSEIEEKLSHGGTATFYSSDIGERFSKIGGRFFGKRIEVEKVTL